MNYHPTLARPEQCRFAFWQDGMIHLYGIGMSSAPSYLQAATMWEAAHAIRGLMHLGTVCCGLLRDDKGTFWNEQLGLVGYRAELHSEQATANGEPHCDYCSGRLDDGREIEKGMCNACQTYYYD